MILTEGSGKWASVKGESGEQGVKIYNVMGDIPKPLWIEFPVGTTLQTILKEVQDAKDIIAAEVGGATEVLISKDQFNKPIGFGRGKLNGVGSIVLISKKRDLLRLYHEKMEFMEEESCTQCVPCRDGSKRMNVFLQDLMKGKKPGKDSFDCMKLVAEAAELTAICAHGKALGSLYKNILKTAQKYQKK